MENTSTLQIGRLTFTVTSVLSGDPRQGRIYNLCGKRGAVYSTVRNIHDPNKMFLINNRRFGVVMNGTELTDINGTLEVL